MFNSDSTKHLESNKVFVFSPFGAVIRLKFYIFFSSILFESILIVSPYLILSFQVGHSAPFGSGLKLSKSTPSSIIISTIFISRNTTVIQFLSCQSVVSEHVNSFILIRSRSETLDSSRKDKSFLISLSYLTRPSLVVSTICDSSSMHIISRHLTQAGLITTDQLNPNNLSTFDNLQSYSRILINSINFDNLQSDKDILILSILLVEHFQFISSCLFEIKLCRLLASLPVGSNHISSALPVRYARFKQNRSIFSSRVLFSRITSRQLIDSSKINSSKLFKSIPLSSSTQATQAFQASSFLIASKQVNSSIQVLLFFLNVCQQCFPNLLICSPIFPTSRKNCRSWFLSSQAFQLFWKRTLYDKLVKTICLPQNP